MKSLACFMLLQGSEGVKPRNLARSLFKDEMRIERLDPRVLSSCSISTESHYNKFRNFQFVEPQSGKKVYLGTMIDPSRNNPQSSKNTLAYPAPANTIVTRSNGYCDKGVYRSWNKCNVNGECFEDCEDGLCHDQHKNNAAPIKVPNDCLKWYIQCAQDCDADENCKAFSFLDTNILGHAEYTCNMMGSLTCIHGGLNQNDPRSSFHVKGSYMEELFAATGATSFGALDTAMEIDPEYRFGHWSSWGYHECKDTPQAGCGVGRIKRGRKMADGSNQSESRPCEWKNDDGEPIACETTTTTEKFTGQGHGWMSWGEWSPCSRTCKAGERKRFRACGKCANPDNTGLCGAADISVEDPFFFYRLNLAHCQEGDELEAEQCHQGYCLPNSSGKWRNYNGRPFPLKALWAPAPKETYLNQAGVDWEGGCVDYSSAYKKLNLDSVAYGNFHNQRGTFTECMRICQVDEKHLCHSVTFFPSVKNGRTSGANPNRFYGTDPAGNEVFNCFLHQRRCHEDGAFRDGDYLSANSELTGQDAVGSWYAFKDLCSAPKLAGYNLCNYMGSYFQSECDSSGAKAFPNTDVCSCPMSGDKITELRAWGNPMGKVYYDEETGLLAKRTSNPDVSPSPLFYSKFKYSKKFSKWNTSKYETHMREGTMACHNPCSHNRCESGAQCVLNSAAEFGYDCLCAWPMSPDPARFGDGKAPVGTAGYDENDGCVVADIRNVANNFKDSKILYGGGWNTQPGEPGAKKLVKPHYQYYGLEATENPWRFQVKITPQTIPAPSPQFHKGKFYNCMMNIEENEVMVVGGRPGQFFDIWDDKAFVYQWGKNSPDVVGNGKWIGTDGSKMDETKEGCKGASGCVRDFDWPDLPSTSVLNCEGQCRNGESGRGPTHPSWLSQYCEIEGQFYNGSDFESMSFSLCKSHLVTDSSGIKVEGRTGKWSSVPVTDDVFEAEWDAYTAALAHTLPFYKDDELETPDIDSLPSSQTKTKNINGRSTKVTNHPRWKRPFPANLFSPILGPTAFRDLTTMFNYPHKTPGPMRQESKDFHGPGQPACGVLGDRAYVGSGKIGKLLSLSHTAPEDTAWRVEPGSDFPYPYKKTTGEECLLKNSDNTRDKFPNYRQNFGTVVTSQGLWIIGGLVAPSADLEGRALNLKYNIEGCTKHAHMNDVWVYNPRGWSFNDIMGSDSALISKYQALSAGDILPKRMGYPEGNTAVANKAQALDQSFDDFRLSDTAGGDFDLTIDTAIDEGWACTGVQGKWCRKPFLPRETKGAESVIMCFEPSTGKENYGYVQFGKDKDIPRRPRACMIDETDGRSNDRCICYIVNVSGQSGKKQAADGSGFRPEMDYIEIPRADGKYGSDHPYYSEYVTEYCPNAEETFPGVDAPIEHGDESAVGDYTECTEDCGAPGQPECNRKWKKVNLRRKWHEAGKIKHPRMGFLAGTLKGEVVIWGGECYGPDKMRHWNLDGTLRATRLQYQPRSCGIEIDGGGNANNDDYIEVFSIIRMNKAGYLFGERRYVELDGYLPGRAGHGEAAVSQAYSLFNTQTSNFE